MNHPGIEVRPIEFGSFESFEYSFMGKKTLMYAELLGNMTQRGYPSSPPPPFHFFTYSSLSLHSLTSPSPPPTFSSAYSDLSKKCFSHTISFSNSGFLSKSRKHGPSKLSPGDRWVKDKSVRVAQYSLALDPTTLEKTGCQSLQTISTPPQQEQHPFPNFSFVCFKTSVPMS